MLALLGRLVRAAPQALQQLGSAGSARGPRSALCCAPTTAGFLAGEQGTPGTPWKIRLTREVRKRFVAESPLGYVPMIVATARLGVSRPSVLEWIRRGKPDAVTICKGRRHGLRIRLPANNQPSLFERKQEREGASRNESSPAVKEPLRPSDA